MNDKNREHLLNDGMEIIDSLNTAIERAGGSHISIKELQSMTAIGFLSMICTNNIRFTYINPKDTKEVY